jgi:hypothetical protein
MDQLKLGQALPTSNNVLDPNITADELANQSDNPLFVAPNEFAATELADVQTQKPAPAYPTNQMMQDEANNIQDQQEKDNRLPDVAGTNENEALLPSSGNVLDLMQNQQNIQTPPPNSQTEYEKLQAKLQELRDLEAAQGETAAKYNFGAKAAAIIGDTLARYNTGGIQKNAKANIQYTGPKLQEMMGIIGEAKAPGTSDQRKELLAQYQQLLDSNKQSKSEQLAERKIKAYEDQVSASKMNKEQKPTEGAKTADREFAKVYGTWKAGGKGDFEESSKIFKEAINALEKGDVSTGTLSGAGSRLPGVRTDTKELETRVRKSLNTMLRSTLGAQFTEQEGEKIFNQTFDPFASKESNIANMQTELDRISSKARDIQDQAKYFEENKSSLSGYKYGQPSDVESKPRKTVVQNNNRFDAETGEFLGKVK